MAFNFSIQIIQTNCICMLLPRSQSEGQLMAVNKTLALQCKFNVLTGDNV
ncbi:hypothetical protein M5D96_002501 [Drosophila gunungcola]|uniref:Uncharacterized protein n=1 Tax=Drosophila gunungcola TaxID=103775 RepID=A0A9P9Z060_9MUSC|nr:hypothetical protein M5D96_002501 [Drosophila gunungcola]